MVHAGCLPVVAAPGGSSTFVLGLCAEPGKEEGWALSVESGLTPGEGELHVLDGGTEDVHPEVAAAAHVVLTVLRCRIKGLRARLGYDPSKAQDLFHPKNSVRVGIGPSTFARSGTSGQSHRQAGKRVRHCSGRSQMLHAPAARQRGLTSCCCWARWGVVGVCQSLLPSWSPSSRS